MGARAALNARFAAEDLPVRVANLCSIWTVGYTRASQYNWMFQYYLRAHGLALSWVGTGRFIFSHNYTDEDFAAVADAHRRGGARTWIATAGGGPIHSSPTVRSGAELLREVLQAWWSGSSSTAPNVTSSIGSMSSPRSSASGAR